MKKFKINLVNYEEGIVENGILTKHARMMERELLDLGYPVTVKNVPDPQADINHHINYISAQKCPTLNTTMVTHFTSDMYSLKDKIKKMKTFINDGGTGICFSKGVAEYLAKEGMSKKQLRVVLPAHDSMKRRPRIIAIAFKVYPDKRKREEMFVKLCKTLDPNKFVFRIIGQGWMPVLEKIKPLKMQVQYLDNFRADFYEELLNTSDYLLYTGGEDAIAQCIVDAKNAALRIIAPKQEHVTVELPWNTQEELNKIFKDIAYNQVEDWNWENYTRQHVTIWREMIENRK